MSRTLTVDAREVYVDSGGEKCPFCFAPYFASRVALARTKGTIRMLCTCPGCDGRWVEWYDLTHITTHNTEGE